MTDMPLTAFGDAHAECGDDVRYRPHAEKSISPAETSTSGMVLMPVLLKILSTEQLTIDHVIPKVEAGEPVGTMLWLPVIDVTCEKGRASKTKKPYEPNYWKMVKLAKSFHSESRSAVAGLPPMA